VAKILVYVTSPIQIMIDQKQPENVEYFNCLDSMITNDTKCTREINSKVAMGKNIFQQEESFHQEI
jgi:hypothetical protein